MALPLAPSVQQNRPGPPARLAGTMASPQNHPLPRPPSHEYHNNYYQPQTPSNQPFPPLPESEAYSPSPPQYSSQQQSYRGPYQQQAQQQYQQSPPPPQRQARRQDSRGQESIDSRPLTKSGSRPRTFSFRSDKSHKSHDLHETHDEKEAKRLHSKADPTLAMNEAEPGVVAATVKSSLAPLRNMQHKDLQGNVIDDPDRSNPTRSRWERPLDTIRSFEAAIDGGYNSRQSMIRSDTDSVANWNRRSSYFSGNNGSMSLSHSRGLRHHSSFASAPSGPSLMYPRVPGSSHVNRIQRDSYYSTRGYNDGGYGGGGYGYGYGGSDGYDMSGPRGYNAYNNGPRQRYSRMATEPQYTPRHVEQNVYPIQGNHRSYETVASGAGSGSSGEHAGYTTDPTSSDNSSIERVQSPPKREPVNDYGIGFSQSPTYTAPSFTVGINNGYNPPPNMQNAYPVNTRAANDEGPPPAVPRKQSTITRKPTHASVASVAAQERPAAPEKRKSWFARRFSKNG